MSLAQEKGEGWKGRGEVFPSPIHTEAREITLLHKGQDALSTLLRGMRGRLELLKGDPKVRGLSKKEVQVLVREIGEVASALIIAIDAVFLTLPRLLKGAPAS